MDFGGRLLYEIASKTADPAHHEGIATKAKCMMKVVPKLVVAG